MSILLQVHSNDRMPLMELWRLIFKFTFDKKSCAYSTKQTIETNLLKWNDLIKYQKRILTEKFGPGFDGYVPVGKKGSVLDEVEYQVGMMCSWVVREENGDFEYKIETFKKAGIDYRLAEPMSKAFPECNKLRNFRRARAALKQAMKDNPQDYTNDKGA